MITIEMIDEGIKQGIIRIEDSSTLPLSSVEIGTPICRIGEYWFYFAGQEGENCLGATNYLLNSEREDIVRQIYDALISFSSSNGECYDEYCYYEWYLKERLNANKTSDTEIENENSDDEEIMATPVEPEVPVLPDFELE